MPPVSKGESVHLHDSGLADPDSDRMELGSFVARSVDVGNPVYRVPTPARWRDPGWHQVNGVVRDVPVSLLQVRRAVRLEPWPVECC